MPLAHLADDQAPFMLYDTVLSEYAALGFEYGYSISVRRARVLGSAVRRLRQRRAGRDRPVHRRPRADKWGQRSSLALLLPHGFEGQGPEHSSARIERYLTLSRRAATSASCTRRPRRSTSTCCAARRCRPSHVPLVCFTPKRYLRMPQTRSPLAAFTDGALRARARRPRRARHRATA